MPFALGNAPLEPWSPRSPCSRRYGCDFAFFERDSKSGELKPRYGYGSSLLAADENKKRVPLLRVLVYPSSSSTVAYSLIEEDCGGAVVEDLGDDDWPRLRVMTMPAEKKQAKKYKRKGKAMTHAERKRQQRAKRTAEVKDIVDRRNARNAEVTREWRAKNAEEDKARTSAQRVPAWKKEDIKGKMEYGEETWAKMQKMKQKMKENKSKKRAATASAEEPPRKKQKGSQSKKGKEEPRSKKRAATASAKEPSRKKKLKESQKRAMPSTPQKLKVKVPTPTQTQTLVCN